MSVISFEEEEMAAGIAISEISSPKIRIAVMGMAKSGKTHFLHTVESEHLRKYGDSCLRKSFSMNDLYEFKHNINSIRHAFNKEILWKKDALEKVIVENNDCDLIMVDDVMFEWELETLQMYNFKLIYITSPWHSRFNRLSFNKATIFNDLNWMTCQEEIDLMKSSNKMKKKYNMIEYVEECDNLQQFISSLIL